MDENETTLPSRKEHLAWSKERAFARLDVGQPLDAWMSLSSDLLKHPETANHMGMELGMLMLMGGHLQTIWEMREFIDGFN